MTGPDGQEGFTALPRWAPGGGTGWGEQRLEAEAPADPAAVLAAWAKVHAALTGEPVVTLGLRTDRAGGPRPCTLDVSGGPWRDLLDQARARLAATGPHAAAPDGTGPPFDTVLDLAGLHLTRDAPAAPGVVLQVSARPGAEPVLRHDRAWLDAAQAARVAGYLATAFRLLQADPDAEHHRQVLLSEPELRFQREALAGPVRPRPRQPFHALFEERARRHPEAEAARCGAARVSYGELNRRANRIAHALLAGGLPAEGVVAVLAERDLDWLAAVLAVFKAGGAYLPIEPHFPAARIEAMLRRSGCRTVLAGTGGPGPAGIGLPVHEIGLLAETGPEHDPGLAIGPERLAYLYFTSGSTGEPKGAMCEHAGLLNHLLAKIEDLGLGPGDVVAQTAPQCFDISLWQLVAGLLVGGRTLIVEQEAVLDVPRFVRQVAAGGVSVLQLVPSYLEAVLDRLDREPAALPALRLVSATGEALRAELVRRWFARCPEVPLVNAYGLTETSDDTNHEVLHRAPADGRVPLGAPIANVTIGVVDDALAPVPLGAPGEIVFTGVCVGRGYVNDPERTRAAFTTDPARPGQRLYRSGDLGRWRPDGKLEFIGRRDAQVKVRGFRIELGEVEDRLSRVPGVAGGAVVVAGQGRARHLVGFYRPAEGGDPGPEQVRDRLAAALPAYMVPGTLHPVPELPLTGNGKVDRKALLRLAGQPATPGEDARPRTADERRLAAAWAEVLGVPVEQIARTDHFFDRGGTSLSAVQLAIRLDRALTPAELAGAPVLADLAVLVGRGTGEPS